MDTQEELNMVASFATGINQEIAQANSRINPSDRGASSEIPLVNFAKPPNAQQPNAQQPNMDSTDPVVIAPRVPDFNSDGFGDMDASMLEVIQQANQAPNVPQRPQQHAMPPQPQSSGGGGRGVFHPDLESSIYRMLTTISKNQQKLIDLLIEDRKIGNNAKGTNSK